MGLESFLIDKLTGLACFIGANILFYAGISATCINFIAASLCMVLGAACILMSLWFMRKE